MVNVLQPWLACSPDGIIIYGSNIWEKKLLEIKCPQAGKENPIFNKDYNKVNVNYLEVDENGYLQLKVSSYIYTQIQVQMYVTGMCFCDLYVYSNIKSELITVRRDESFLKETIIKLESFYFNYYLPKLITIMK